jgi:DNA-directed RNA polymerase specialized sigma24 family protein
MTSEGSVTNLIGHIKSGDAEAARKLWELFSARLLQLARKHLQDEIFPIGDEEDIVVSALGSFCCGAERGKFAWLDNRRRLWGVLSSITRRKILDMQVHERRRPDRLSGGSAAGARETEEAETALDPLLDPKFAPDVQALTEEAAERLLDALGDMQLRTIALWKLEGRDKREIAAMLGCTMRTVHRKFELIRRIWCQTSDV